MRISSLHSYLVTAGKNIENPDSTHGASIPGSGNLFNMLRNVFDRAEFECRIPIRFIMGMDGSQDNLARSLLLEYIADPTLDNGRNIAHRLRNVTTNKSGLGLLFLIIGQDNSTIKVVVSRFPADQGVVAEASARGLDVQFIERVFMKNSASYKAALYSGSSVDGDFWSGYAVDKQLNDVADYWIREFLESDFVTTSKEGTRNFARALRDASRSVPDLRTKHELVALSTLIPGLANQVISIEEIFNRYSLSEEAREAVLSNLPHRKLAEDTFLVDINEYAAHAVYASVELDNGGILLAPPDQFERCFEREVINEENLEYRFTTTGQVVDERVRGK